MDGLLVGPDLRKGQQPTFYEQYGSACCNHIDSNLGTTDFTDHGLLIVTTAVWNVVIWVNRAAITIFQWAFSLQLGAKLSGAITSAVQGLRDTVYGPFLLTFIIGAGLWALWHGLVRHKATTVTEGLVWAVAALITGSFVLSNPGALIRASDAVGGGIGRSILAGVSKADPKTGIDDGTTAKATFSTDNADTQLRVSADRMWRTYVFVPWTVLEFGSTDAGKQYGQRLVAANLLSPDEQRQLYEAGVTHDPFAALQLMKRKADQRQGVVNAIQNGADQGTKDWFAGHQAGSRLAIATLSLLTSILIGALIVLLSVGLLLAQLAFLVLLVMAPLFLLLAIYPGHGRVIGKRWMEVLGALVVKRIGFAAILAVILVISGAVLSTTYSLGWGIAMTLQVLIAGVAMWYRKPFTYLFKNDAAASAAVTSQIEHRSRVGLSRALEEAGLLATGTKALQRAWRGRRIAHGDHSKGREDSPSTDTGGRDPRRAEERHDRRTMRRLGMQDRPEDAVPSNGNSAPAEPSSPLGNGQGHAQPASSPPRRVRRPRSTDGGGGKQP